MPIRQQDPVNNVATPTLRSKSPLKWSYPHFSTQRFAQIDPVFVLDTVPADDLKLVQRSVLNTYTLKAPMLNKVVKHYGYYSVPKCAILPHTWSKIFVNPKKGDDVVGSDVNAIMNPTDLWNFFAVYFAFVYNRSSLTNIEFTEFLRALVLCLEIFGPDSIALKLKIPFVSIIGNQSSNFSGRILFQNINGSDPYAALYSVFSTEYIADSGGAFKYQITERTASYYVNINYASRHEDLGLSDFFDMLMNTYGIVHIDFANSNSYHSFAQSIIGAVFGYSGTSAVSFPYGYMLAPRIKDINIQRLAAYQMVCASFATRDTVDDVYTTELYRQNMEALYLSVLGNVKTFVWNGINIIYDWCSGAITSALLKTDNAQNPTKSAGVIHYLQNLFYPAKSLRYGDLFNSMRTDPFAVGDTDIEVQDNKVSVIDTVYNILKEKFLNLVNNVPNTVAKYSQAVFGVVPNNLPAEPYKLGECSFEVKSNVNVNLANNQGEQQNNLTGMYSGVSFRNHHFTQDEIIIGITWYTMEMPYLLNLSPFGLKYDRFDGFLPQLQNIGSVEVDSQIFPGATSFAIGAGYLPNDYEYKQDYGDAVGAFLDSPSNLPGWARSRSLTGLDAVISPWFIRPRIAEMDSFYKSLTGVGANYFHFICSDYFEVYSQRPMEYIPSVLGNF